MIVHITYHSFNILQKANGENVEEEQQNQSVNVEQEIFNEVQLIENAEAIQRPVDLANFHNET